MKSSSPLKRLVSQTAIYGLSSIVGRLLNYLLVPLYTRIFMPEVYGVVTELYSYVVFLMVLLTYGMETAFFRYAELKNDTGRVFSSAMLPLFVTSLSFIVLTQLFAQPIANGLGYAAHPEYFRWFGLIVGLDAFVAVPFAKLRQQNKAMRFAGIKLLNIGTSIGLNLFFLLYCPAALKSNPESWVQSFYSPEIGVGYIFISNLVASILTFFLLIKDIFVIRFRFDKQLFREMLRYGAPLLVVGFAGSINEVLDRVLLKHLVVVPDDAAMPAHDYVMAQLGIYGANYKIAVFMTLFIQTFRYAAEPFFFKQAREKNAKPLYARVMTYFILFGLFIFLGIVFFLDIVKHFIGEEYHSGLHIVPVLLLANLFLGIVFNLSVWYKLNNLNRYGAYISLAGALITIVLNVILVPVAGYTGAAWATLVCYFGMATLSYFLSRRFFPIPYNLKKIGLYFAFALILFIISKLYSGFSHWVVYGFNAVLLLIYMVVVAKNEKLLKGRLRF